MKKFIPIKVKNSPLWVVRIGRVRCVSFGFRRRGWSFGINQFFTCTHYNFGPLFLSVDRLRNQVSGIGASFS